MDGLKETIATQFTRAQAPRVVNLVNDTPNTLVNDVPGITPITAPPVYVMNYREAARS